MTDEHDESIATRRFFDTDTQEEEIVNLYRSQLDALVEKVRQRPDIVELMAEDYASWEAEPEAWRERFWAEGLAFHAPLMELAEQVGIDAYVTFGKEIEEYVWDHVRKDIG